MNGAMGAIFGITLVCWMIFSSVALPIHVFDLWLAKRDCELLNDAPCVWQMLPEVQP